MLENSNKKSFRFQHLSIQQRLPLFICILLSSIILAFSGVSYIGVKRASIAIGSERLTTLVEKLSLLFKESIQRFAASTEAVAKQESVQKFVASGGKEARKEVLSVLHKFKRTDTLCYAIQLMNSKKQNIMSLGDTAIFKAVTTDSLITKPVNAKLISVGKIIFFKSSMYYPVIAEVKDKDQNVGYMVSWRVMKTNQKNIDQLSQLLGANGKLYFGNDDEKFWTDLIKPVANPPIELTKLQRVAQYSRKEGQPLMGSIRKIPNSRWLILVELSNSSVLRTAHLFLGWIIAVGSILVIVGSLGGWIMSKNITRPLNELNKATSTIAHGDYFTLVDINRKDELGSLAESFNIMAIHVQNAHQNLEQKVQERTRQLETAIIDIKNQKENEKKKDEFISIASHELKTPLTTVKAFFQLAKREIQPEFKSFNFINKATVQLNRMERLIEDLLDVSKINSGKMQYNLEEFNFNEVLSDAVNSVQEISPAHKLILEKSACVKLKADRHRMEQVIINLLNNAVKYSPGATQVLIRSEMQDDELLVSIHDFGIGIEKEHLNNLFKRFYRIDAQHRFQGLGLGLFISSEIIKRHGGNIWVDSETGKGSVFKFKLPIRQS